MKPNIVAVESSIKVVFIMVEGFLVVGWEAPSPRPENLCCWRLSCRFRGMAVVIVRGCCFSDERWRVFRGKDDHVVYFYRCIPNLLGFILIGHYDQLILLGDKQFVIPKSNHNIANQHIT